VFGLTFDKLLVIGVIAVFLLGPERLPTYAVKLATLVKGLRKMANNAKERMREEMGDEFDEVEWQKLDPRRYDPRRIIREALLEDPEPARPAASAPTVAQPAAPAPASSAPAAPRDASAGTPFDLEST
jgi:sec-independent protein translocase protein TatB